MRKSLVISEQDSIAALLENGRVVEFFVNRGELLLGDIYTCSVENILPGIDAAFVNLGKDKMGFLHANDVPGQGPLKERLVPKQKMLVQITKEPTGHKGPRVSTAISLPGRFLVLVPEERGVSISRRISESRERARLKSVVNLMKPPGIGLIIRTEAKGQGEEELYEDFEQLWDTWQTIVSEAEESIGPTLIYRDQDLLCRVIRDAYSSDVNEIIVDSPEGQKRASDYLSSWMSKNTRISHHNEEQSLLVAKGVDREIESALTDRAELPSGGHLNIQPTEALTVIDVNSGRFTSSRTQAETVRRTNLEAAQEIPRQLRLRNIGGMVIVDFIDMESRRDQQQVLEVFQRTLEEDRAKPQIGQLSDLGLVELTRRRQGQSLRELFTLSCSHCVGQGIVPDLVIGSKSNTRAISIKTVEEDPVTKKPAARGGKALKSASATSGRVVSTVADKDDVPQELLDQVHEDDDREERRRRKYRAQAAALREEEDDDEPTIEEEVTLKVSGDIINPSATLVEESLTEDASGSDETLADELSQSISAVEEVYNDISVKKDDSINGEIIEPEESSSESEDDSNETRVELAEEYEVTSPHEAVASPVSGIFTLKSKPEDEADSEVVEETEPESVNPEEARQLEPQGAPFIIPREGEQVDAAEVVAGEDSDSSGEAEQDDGPAESGNSAGTGEYSPSKSEGGLENVTANTTYGAASSEGAGLEPEQAQKGYDQLKLASFTNNATEANLVSGGLKGNQQEASASSSSEADAKDPEEA